MRSSITLLARESNVKANVALHAKVNSCYNNRMYSFFIKKNFFDGWDNMLSLVVTNLVCLAAFMGLASLVYAARNVAPLAIALVVFCCVALSILAFAYGESAARIANFEGTHIADYFKSIPSVIKDGTLFGLLLGAIGAAAYVCVPFYFAQRNLFAMFIGSMFLWLLVFTLLSLQWFLALRSLLHDGFKKCLKKCFIIFFDNAGFSVFMLFYNLILAAISVFLFGMLPSVAGMTLAQTNALRLRLYKYDYLQAHPDLGARERRYIPWDELLEKDKETLGQRSLKSLIFPWKY